MKLLITLFILSYHSLALAQLTDPEPSQFSFKDGVIVQHKPSNFLMKFRFRIQNRMDVVTEDAESLDLEEVEFLTRRLRLKFDGTALDPRLLYKIELGFTRNDQSGNDPEGGNTILDAIIGYRWHPQHTVFMGSTKLPGNRERVVSSGDLQFVDRSLLNSIYNIDRDQGIFHNSQFWDARPIWFKFAVTNGEGRNQPNPNASLAFTGRIEWLPYGAFEDRGDYFESDLAREESPKLSIGISTSRNQQTNRTAGQLGRVMDNDETRDLETHFADLMFKYQGWSVLSEVARRNTADPIIDADTRVITGDGFNVQAGYLFTNDWETALRYTQINPTSDLAAEIDDQKQYTAGVSRYLKKHAIKVQSDLSYSENNLPASNEYSSNWTFRLQLELGM